MTDSDPSRQGPFRRLRDFLGTRGKQASPAVPEHPEKAVSPQVMRLGLAEFEQLRVDDVMVPRADIKAVEAGTGLQELLK